MDTNRILYEDSDIIAIDKSHGELVVVDRWKQTPLENILLHSLGQYLREQGHKADESGRDLYPVHRLDRDTSGVVLFAKNQKAHRAFSLLFEQREMKKFYWAFVGGRPDWDRCQVSIPIARAEGKRGRGRAVLNFTQGNTAVTEFIVRQRREELSLLEASPHTGKLHQIRVHLRAMGFPLLLDPLYGISKEKEKQIDSILLTRTPLHAKQIVFIHPFLQKKMEISSPLPSDLRRLYNLFTNN